jgi:hypothetical protein
MAEPVFAEFRRVDDRALRGPSTQVRWAREMAITLLRRESSSDAPGCPPPPRLRTLPTHVIHKHLRCIHPHQPHRHRSCILPRSCDRWHVIIHMPIQTPVSTALRSPRKKFRGGIVSVHSWTHQMWNRRVRPLLRRRSLPMIPLEDVQMQRSKPWLKPKDFATIRSTNANDVRCVSWILRNITDPEALDATIRFTGTIRWFED